MDEGFVEISNLLAAEKGHRTYENPETGLTIRFDEGKEGRNGFAGVDHYHVDNPNSTGDHDLYLDSDGNPVAKRTKASHILPD